MAPAPAYALTRRSFLRKLAAVGAVAALGSVIDACSATATPSPTEAPTPGETAEPPSLTPSATPVPTPVPSHEAELSIYGWDGYLADDTVAGFEKRYGIKVRYETFIDQETQVQRLRSDGKGGGFDVTYPAALDIPTFVADGIVRPIDGGLVPNLANLGPEWADPIYDPGNAHSIPNYWWTTGFAWNPDQVAKAGTRWADLWNPSIAGHLAMLDDMRLAFAAGAFALGLSPNTTSDDDLDRILAKLQELRPLVGSWTIDPIGDIESGDIWLTECTSRDWTAMTADLPEAQYAIPNEGAIRGNDTITILSGAKHPVAAHLWLDYNLEPQIAANNANALGTMTPNAAAIALGYLGAPIRDEPRLNPPADVFARLQALAPLSADDLDKYAQRWELLRAPAP